MQANGFGTRRLGAFLFDLRHTVESAQPLTFHADYDSDFRNISYISGRHAIHVRAFGAAADCKLHVSGDDPDFAKSEVRRRFRLSDDLPRIYEKINADGTLTESVRRYRGMRLTLNDPWETTVCFIISQFNNVPRIRKIVRKIIETYGTGVVSEEGRILGRAFPGSEELARASIRDLMACGTGFRAKYIRDAADYCTHNIDLHRLNPHNYAKLKEALMEINGIGDKVADCIALMGYGSLEAFPIDVWVKRTVERMYFKGRKKSIKQIHRFAEERFGRHAGYAQQYIFWSGRQMDKEPR